MAYDFIREFEPVRRANSPCGARTEQDEGPRSRSAFVTAPDASTNQRRRWTMTADRRRLALRAATRAYALRASAGIALDSPLCVYDVAEDRSVEVRFADVPSME